MLIALLYLAFGALAVWGARAYGRALHEGLAWPTTPGRVLERGLGPALGNNSYMPLVRYSYTVDGREYTNDQVYLVRRSGGLAAQMRRLVDRLPDPVPVHYDPQDPGRSYLVANPRGMYWLVLGVAGLALLLGLAQLLEALLGS
jgi:hypothetical protein